AWEIKYGPRLPLRTEGVSQALFASLPDLPRWLHGESGIFQYLDSVMPPVTYLLWTALLLGLVAVAFWLGDGRQRTALLMAVGAAIGVPVVLQAFAMRPIGWGVQGRHVLPVGVLVPLVANEVAVRRGRVLRLPSAPVAVVCSFVYFVGFYSDARRSAIGYGGSWLFPLHPQWSPPFGWWPWIFCAICGAALLGRARLESLVEVSGWTTE